MSANGNTALPISVQYELIPSGEDEEATLGADFNIVNSDGEILTPPYSLDFKVCHGIRNIYLHIINDDIQEFDEYLKLKLVNPVNAPITAGGDEFLLKIRDNDIPKVSFDGVSKSVQEGQSGTVRHTIPITLDKKVGVDTEIRYRLTYASKDLKLSGAERDCEIIGLVNNEGVVKIEERKEAGIIEVDVFGDMRYERDERFKLELTGFPSNIQKGKNLSFNFSIRNDDKKPGEILYVDQNATGTRDGLTWENAFVSLQDALAEAARYSQVTKAIHIAEGTYYPYEGDLADAAQHRNKTFILIEGVDIVGGFHPIESPVFSNPQRYSTILSGDIDRNDNRAADVRSSERVNYDNSFHVVTVEALSDVTIEGVTITGGNATGSPKGARGAGIFSEESALAVKNCRFIDNVILPDGNTSEISRGGAIYASAGSLSVDKCHFEGNSVTGLGGALFAWQEGLRSIRYEITRSTFIGNRADRNGGAVIISAGELDQCTFENNSTFGNGGALFAREVTVRRSTFTYNTTGGVGGAFAYVFDNTSSTVDVRDIMTKRFVNCLFDRNVGTLGAALGVSTKGNNGDHRLELVNCTIGENISTDGAVYCHGSNGAGNITLGAYNTLWWYYHADLFPDIVMDGTATAQQAELQYCNLKQTTGYGGANNTHVDPLFWGRSFRLSRNSPLINKGDNTYVGQYRMSSDVSGAPRIYRHSKGGIVDIGAYELQRD